MGRPSRQTIRNANPLVAFRAPRRLPRVHVPVMDGHFYPKREDYNANSMLEIMPGDFIYKPDPTLEIDLKVYAEDNSAESAKSSFNLFGREGFKAATTDEFEIAEHMAFLWVADAGKRIVLQHGQRVAVMVLVWRTGEAYDRAQRRLTAASDEVQKTMEAKMAEMADAASEKYGNQIRSTVTVADEDVYETHEGDEE
jgi:hypothetical protein